MVVARSGGLGSWLRKPTNRLMFRSRRQEELLANKLGMTADEHRYFESFKDWQEAVFRRDVLVMS